MQFPLCGEVIQGPCLRPKQASRQESYSVVCSRVVELKNALYRLTLAAMMVTEAQPRYTNTNGAKEATRSSYAIQFETKPKNCLTADCSRSSSPGWPSPY